MNCTGLATDCAAVFYLLIRIANRMDSNRELECSTVHPIAEPLNRLQMASSLAMIWYTRGDYSRGRSEHGVLYTEY